MTEKSGSNIQVVTSESELNDAIVKLNEGADITEIDVQASFALTSDVTGVTKSVKMLSSNGSSIMDGGYTALTVSGGAQVTVAMDLGGAGSVVVDDVQGGGTRLIGMSGGVIGTLVNGGNFEVPAGNTFKTNGVYGSANQICGTLDNSATIEANGPFIVVGNANGVGGKVNGVNLTGGAQLNIASQSKFTAGPITVQELSSVNSDGSATLVTDAGIRVIGDPKSLQLPGTVTGVNIEGEITLLTQGVYQGVQDGGGTTGGSATKVTNSSGRFSLGEWGTWSVGAYTQEEGVLSIDIPDYTGGGPLLKVERAEIRGGTIEVNAKKYFTPPGFTEETIPLIEASERLSIADLPRIFKHTGFSDPGVIPSLSQKGNTLYLTMKKDG